MNKRCCEEDKTLNEIKINFYNNEIIIKIMV